MLNKKAKGTVNTLLLGNIRATRLLSASVIDTKRYWGKLSNQK